jgi:hypothetical protein
MLTLLTGFGLMALCVGVHAFGLAAAFRWLDRLGDRPRPFLHWTRLLIAIAGWTILVHLLEIAVWALFYAWRGALPDLATALYFSAVTYTTTGYGDVVLPEGWRLVGAIESLTGILMCGWSTGFFFALVSRIHVSTRSGEAGRRP